MHGRDQRLLAAARGRDSARRWPTAGSSATLPQARRPLQQRSTLTRSKVITIGSVTNGSAIPGVDKSRPRIGFAALLAHRFPLLEVDAQLVKILVQRVANGHDAKGPIEFDDRQVAKLALVHHPQRAHERLVGMDRLRLRRHHVGESRRMRIAALGEQPEQRVALGEDADQPR